jgi:PAS domain S-box-containing protein
LSGPVSTSRQSQAVARRYSWIALASAVPLILVVVLLTLYQFDAQRRQMLVELEGEIQKHSSLFDNVIKTVRDHAFALDSWAELYLTEPGLNAEPTLAEGDGRPAPAGPRWRPDDSVLFRADETSPVRPDMAAEIVMAEGLVQHMRIAHRAMPYLRWSFYLGGDREVFSLYPLSRPDELGGALRSAAGASVIERMAELMPLDLAPTRRPRWSAAFLDPAGAAWMVAATIPVVGADGAVGVVGSSVLLDFLNGFIRAFDYPAGRLWLVDQKGQLLAASDGLTVSGSGLRLLTIEDVLPAALPAEDLGLGAMPAAGFREIDGYQVFSRRISTTPWTLVYILTPGEITAEILPRFVPYGVILGGLILTLLLAQTLRQRLIVGPALTLVDYIKSESQDRPMPAPKLPAMWQPWVEAVALAFAAKRAATERILQSEAYFRTMTEAHPVPVALIELETGRVLHGSQGFADLLSMSLEELQGANIRSFYVDPADRTRLVEKLRAEGGRVQNFEHWAKRKDGTIFLASVTSRPITFQGIEAVVSGVVDLTEQRAMEAELAAQREALRQSEQRFRTIAEGHPVPVGIVRRADRKILYVSRPFANLLRVPLEQLYTSDPRAYYADEADREKVIEALKHPEDGPSVELTVKRPDGTTFPATVVCHAIEYEGEDAVVSSIVDLTELKAAEAEIARQRDALHQAEKLNALGSLLASVAHELNNPLSVVVGYATMMLDFTMDPTARDRAEKIHAAAERCARIVRTFLAMARQKAEVREAVDLNQVLEAALEIAGYGLRTADVELVLELDPELPSIEADSDQLTLVFMNLIVNAQHALQNRTTPRQLVITTGHEKDAVFALLADNGPGIDGAIVAQIFDPFFTTKPQGVGTGIGLSVCQSVVSAHEGEILAGSSLSRGALFVIRLPRRTGRATLLAQSDRSEATAGRTGKVMVVEDEPDIRDMIAEVLTRDGHRVIAAASGREALEQLENDEVDLVVSDLRMPDLGGPDLYRLLAERRPHLARRILFITGDTLAHDLGDFFARTGLPNLEKPLEPAELRDRVRRLIDRDAAAAPAKQS